VEQIRKKCGIYTCRHGSVLEERAESHGVRAVPAYLMEGRRLVTVVRTLEELRMFVKRTG
jgi:hypothetical protein